MKLLTKEILEAFAKQGPTNEKSSKDIKAIAKFFTPDAQATWIVSDWIPEDGVFFGYCNLGDDEMAELGYVALAELEAVTGQFGLHVERDKSFPIGKYTMQEVIDKHGRNL